MKNELEDKALTYIKDFASTIGDCETIEEYHNLVIAVFIFSNLVKSHFLDASDDNHEVLEDLEKVAALIAEKVLVSIEFNKNKVVLN